jgi:glycosyltransferase involved in cell wall biosynthesis
MAADVPDSRDTGLGRHQWFLARELEKRGFFVRELYSHDLPSRGHRGLRRFTFPWIVLREAQRGTPEGKSYDLTLVHEGSAGLVCLARRLRMVSARSVVVCHNVEQKVWERRLDYVCRGLDRIAWKSRLSWPASRLWQSNLAIRCADLVLCLATEDVEFIQKRFELPASRTALIANGVEPQFFLGPRQQDGPRALFLGSWLSVKGIAVLVSALSDVLRRFPGASTSLVGVSLPESSVLREFPEALRPRLKVRSHFAPEELPEILAQHNIFVLPSRFEGMPLALLEAMAAGLAPLVTAVGGMRDIIHDGIDGLSVPPDDAGALTKALERLCSDRELRTRLGVAARERARSFTWERAGERLAGILRAAAGDRAELSTVSEASECIHPSKTNS